ncbi:MAG: SDR family oxidoreductase [Fibrobacter sp.]|nr:SDR family oxidoreductase [Fibrobacter sp.]
MTKVVVTGAAGMLGSAVIDFFQDNYEVVATDIAKGYESERIRWVCLDLQNEVELSKFISTEKPDVIIHCAALVNVDGCEKNPAFARAIHKGTTESIVKSLAGTACKIVYISTDSVFDGQRNDPYKEQDQINPPNMYALTKAEGEEVVKSYHKGLILRTNIFGWSRAEKISFAEWVLKGIVSGDTLTMFTDVKYTPIHVTHLAEVIHNCIQKNLSGLYHATGSTILSKYDFAKSVADKFGLSSSMLIPSVVDDAGLAAKRPRNMALNNSMLQSKIDFTIPGVDKGIELLKYQIDSGWLRKLKGRTIKSNYKFWES